ncbi:MAG: hypothetical protein WA633_04840 [Stellaceae bacterium]
MTKSQRIRLSAVMISSTIPSAKYSCSGSPLILAKGSTAIDGLSGSGKGAPPAKYEVSVIFSPAIFTSNTRTGRAIFLTCCSPLSSKAKLSLSRTWSRTTLLTQIPPGGAKASSRAATLTPSP